MRPLKNFISMITACSVLVSCGQTTVKSPTDEPSSQFQYWSAKLFPKRHSSSSSEKAENAGANIVELTEILSGTGRVIDLSTGFINATASAVSNDPSVRAAKTEVDGLKAMIASLESEKEFQVSGTAYGGVEDVSDQTSGLALVLSANRMVFDGGQLESQILSAKHETDAAEHQLRALMDQKAYELLGAWVDLDRYQRLQFEIDSRLDVLNPLIEQLERVASAGVGDITQVSSAQRTVNEIRVTKADIDERLEWARLNFKNYYGDLPAKMSFDAEFVDKLMPSQITKPLVEAAPALLAQYSKYLSAEANLQFEKLKEKPLLRFETKLSTPLGGSGYDETESVGLVLSKKFYDGGEREARVDRATQNVDAARSNLRQIYRDGKLKVETAQQTIRSMEVAIRLANENAQAAREEIQHLRKQLVIGGSSLESILAAEARLYNAEAKAIHFRADRAKAQLTILGALGLLTNVLKL